MELTDIAKDFSLDILNASSDIIYGISNDMRLSYMNPAWFIFAKNNSGEPEITQKFSKGAHLADSISGKLAQFYLDSYQQILTTKKIWTFEYECSSDFEFRFFTQIAYPLKSGKGIVLVNRLRFLEKMDGVRIKAAKANQEDYLQKNGFIYQCSNCRCVEKRATKTWDWVPEWVVNIPPNTSHTVSPTCEQYFWKI